MICCGLVSLGGITTGCPVRSRGFPQRIAPFYRAGSSREKKKTWLGLVCLSPRSYDGLPRSIIHRFVSFPLLRRPSLVTVPPWVAWWVRVFKADYNGSLRSILFFSFRTPRALTFKVFLPRAFLTPKMTELRTPLRAIKLIIGLDFA